MQYLQYITYKDIYGRDISTNECIFKIKLIYKKYNREVILSFLGYISKEIGIDATPTQLLSLQNTLGIKSNRIAIHNRAALILYIIFYESIQFNANNLDKRLLNEDVSFLFLFSNQILNKTDLINKNSINNKITIEMLMASMRLYIGTINVLEARLTNVLFINFYKKLKQNDVNDNFSKIIKTTTGIDIGEFIEILENFRDRKGIKGIFNIYDKFAVLNYNDIYEVWNKRIPKLPIYSEYRFFEEYPLIKKENEYFPTSGIMLFISIMRKIYHLLSSNIQTKNTFRSFWGKDIVEPIIKDYVKNIFKSEEIKVIDIDFQKIIGVEPADLILIHKDDIYLLEIKSGYMALEHRYTDDINLFKIEFEKKYVLTSNGKHQLINQLEIFESKYDKIAELCKLQTGIKYKVFSGSLVFDESLSMLGFKRYLGEKFNLDISSRINNFSKFIPFFYSNVLTFTELLSISEKIPDPIKRIHFYKASFNYHDSINDFFEDINENRIKVDGITSNDISYI